MMGLHTCQPLVTKELVRQREFLRDHLLKDRKICIDGVNLRYMSNRSKESWKNTSSSKNFLLYEDWI